MPCELGKFGGKMYQIGTGRSNYRSSEGLLSGMLAHSVPISSPDSKDSSRLIVLSPTKMKEVYVEELERADD